MTATRSITPDELARVLSGPEIRTFGTELREANVEQSGRWIEGRAVPYGEWADIGGWFRESFRRGAFAKSIREAAFSLPLLLFHNGRTFPIGKADEWREEDSGLFGVWKIDDADAEAVKAHRKAHDGFLNGLSVGFQPVESWARDEKGKVVTDRNGNPIDLANEIEWDEITGQLSVTRVEARLLETSLTPTPAYVNAGTTLVRSAMLRPGVERRPARHVREARAWLDEVRKNALR